MKNNYNLSPNRVFSREEKELIWLKPDSHKTSTEEIRICQEVFRNWDEGEMKISNILLEGDAGSGKTQLAKALSSDFGLPYTKVTCFADMDKSDILGSILPVIGSDDESGIQYEYYPSEIVRAYENGYLLEIQEPTVIRDAAVLMALNSALEPDGSLNLPTRIVRRHPDFIAVITTNRNYAGCRPLNESLRDRVQHTEKMDLPSKEVMIDRAIAKTGYDNTNLLNILADIIILLDGTSRANGIKGVAGMRSFFFWVDAVKAGLSAKSTLYQKVIYKITTDDDEIRILEESLASSGLDQVLADAEKTLPEDSNKKKHHLTKANTQGSEEIFEIKAWGDISEAGDKDAPSFEIENPLTLKKAADSEHSNMPSSSTAQDEASQDLGVDGMPSLHESKPDPILSITKEEEAKAFRKKLNQDARKAVSASLHKKVKLIVHRPDFTSVHVAEYEEMKSRLLPIVRKLAKGVRPLLEFEETSEWSGGRYYGTRFQAEKAASPDLRHFAKKQPPHETPTLVVGLRVDESASMSAFGRLEAAKRAAIAVYEFCLLCDIPVLVCGDTSDTSHLEQMSVFTYTDFLQPDPCDPFRMMCIEPRGNNRDGMALRIMSEKLMTSSADRKLLISLSDGQPKAMPDYTGALAVNDMQDTIKEYERKGITFLAAAIGQDKEVIQNIYGTERFLDITDLNLLPAKLVKIISRYL